MIRCYVTRDDDKDGGWHIYITGHANTMVCAGVSSAFHGVVKTLQWIAEKYPRQCVVIGTARAKGKVFRKV